MWSLRPLLLDVSLPRHGATLNIDQYRHRSQICLRLFTSGRAIHRIREYEGRIFFLSLYVTGLSTDKTVLPQHHTLINVHSDIHHLRLLR